MKKSLKVVSMFMIFFIAISTIQVNGVVYTNSVVTDPFVVGVTSISNQTFSEGQDYTITFMVKNNDFVNWQDMFFKLDFLDAPIYVVDGNDGVYLKDFLVGREYELTYKIHVATENPGDFLANIVVDGTSAAVEDMDVVKEFYVKVLEVTSDVFFYGTASTDTAINGGVAVPLDIDFTLDGDTAINDVKISAVTENSGLAVLSGSIYRNVVFKDKQVTLPLIVKATEDLASGFYTINYTVEYTQDDAYDKVFTQTVPITLEVDNDAATDSTDISVSTVKVSDGTLFVGQQSTLATTVKNNSADTIDELTVSLEYADAVVPVSQDTIVLHNFLAGEERVVSFTVEATDDATTRNYSLGILFEYEGLSKKTYGGVFVTNDDDEDTLTSKPKMMITKYTTGVDKVYAGDNFDLQFTVANTNSSQIIKNIKITVDEEVTGTATKVFMPFGTGSSTYIDSLNPKEEEAVKLSYGVLDAAEGDVYSLLVTYDYEDVDGNAYVDTETLSIPVYQIPVLVVSDVRYGSVLENGFKLEADFYNTGKIDIDNLMVDIEVDGFETANSNYYVGTFETGRTDVYDVELTAAKPDSISGRLIFTYDDTFGDSVEVVKEFTIGGVTTTEKTGTTASGAIESGPIGAASMRGTGTGTGNVQIPEGMTQEEFRAAIQSGKLDIADFESDGASQSPNYALYGGLGFLAVAVIVLMALRVRKKKREAK